MELQFYFSLRIGIPSRSVGKLVRRNESLADERSKIEARWKALRSAADFGMR